MASLHGLPPLPKSLSALLNFSSSQWKEMERMHAMRTMIQQDLSRGTLERPPQSLQRPKIEEIKVESPQLETQEASDATLAGSSRSRLDAQLALLRKEMVGLRQLDMSLLCQLWSLNESIQEYKHIIQDRMSVSHASSPGWDNSDDSVLASPRGRLKLELPPSARQRRQRDLTSVPERLSSDSSSSHSSFEYGDI